MADSVGERVPVVLPQAACSVRRFLEEILPTLSPSWWADLVVATLSFQQRRAVETRRITALSGLDLAALLRVLDANWYAIADRLGLPSEARHYLKEMRTVRGRWAHAAARNVSSVGKVLGRPAAPLGDCSDLRAAFRSRPPDGGRLGNNADQHHHVLPGEQPVFQFQIRPPFTLRSRMM